MWALYFKGTGIFLLTTEDGFSFILGVDCLAIYLEGTDIFLLDIFTVEDDVSLILGYRLLDLMFERY